MSRKKIKEALKDFGLTDKEAEIYIFLAKHGVLTGGEIAKQTKMHRPIVYRILKSLQKKGVVESTLESPIRFSSIPFENVVEKNIQAKHEEASLLEKTKKGLLSDWNKVYGTRIAPEVGKFFVIEGNKKIYSKISQMIKETKKYFSAVFSVTELVRNEQYGVYDAIYDHPLKDKIKFQFLTEISSRQHKAMKLLIPKLKSDLDLKGTNPDSNFAQLPRMVIRDGEEVLFFISPKSEIFKTGQNESVIFTDNQSLIQTLEGIFKDLDRDSFTIKKQILEMKTGKLPVKPSVTKAKVTIPVYEQALTQVKEFTRELPLLNAQLERIVNSQPSLVGRENELRQLKGLIDKALHGNGKTVFISGEAGIGKTRLVNEVVRYARAQNFTVLEHRCSYESSTPLLPIRKILEQLFTLSSEDNSETRKEKIREKIEEYAPELAHLTPEIQNAIVNPYTILSPFAEEDLMQDISGVKNFFDSATELAASSQLLSAFSQKNPIMIVIDDLHLADSSTLKLFQNLAGLIVKSQLFLVGAYRTEATMKVYAETKHPFSEFFQNVNGEAWYNGIELERLNVEETAILIKMVLGIDNFLLIKRIQTVTEGNPFFVLETLKFLINKKILQIQNYRWKLTKDLDEISISPRIYDLISRRIDILREDERDVIDCASVVGEEFSSDILQKITGLGRLQLLKKLSRVERKYQLIHLIENKFRFDHSKIREVLYQEINPELRKEYHSMIGSHLENQSKDYSNEELHQIAYHYSKSKDPQKAVPYLLEAGKRSQREFAVFETIRYYSEALKLMKDREKWNKKQIDILEALGNLYATNAEHKKANECYMKILAITQDEKTKARVQRKIRQKRIVENNGVKLAYFVYGEGKKTMIFHSWRGSAELWMPQVAYFSQNYKVVTLDMRGTGESDKPPGEYAIDTDVDDLAKVIEDLESDEIIVVATFLGAKIATKYVVEYPKRISKLVFFSFDPKSISAQPYVNKEDFEESYRKALKYPSLGMKMFWETLFPDPSYQLLRDWGLRISEKTPPEIFLKSHHNLSEEDVSPLIKKISIPTLMLNSGYYGDMNAPKNITWVQEYFSDSETTLSITVKSLFLNVFLPDKFNKTIERFLT